MAWRDVMCGELRADDADRRVTVAGWVDTRRDHGGLVFVDLRDHTGKIQLVINPERSTGAAKAAHEIRNEFVLQAVGEVVPRAPERRQPEPPDRRRSRSRSTSCGSSRARRRCRSSSTRRTSTRPCASATAGSTCAPTGCSGTSASTTRRSPRIRRVMDELGFVDVWTPSMTRGTPEGARDFLVPVRLQPGQFFALAQSPQLFKQLCMVGGIDRYYQIATCWRDEDLRADRQFEFRQLDFEMAFVEREDVLGVMEACVVGAFEASGVEPPQRPFPRLSYADAMLRYGSDKPDLRFGMEIQDATEVTRGSEFGVFKNAPCVRYVVRAEDVLPRRAVAARGGREGVGGEGPREPDADLEVPLRARARGASASPEGSTALFVADEEPVVAHVLGLLRLHLARELDLIDGSLDVFHWVTDFPLFEVSEEYGGWTFMHHPFTAPGLARRRGSRPIPRTRAGSTTT